MDLNEEFNKFVAKMRVTNKDKMYSVNAMAWAAFEAGLALGSLPAKPLNQVNATDKKPLCAFCKVQQKLHKFNKFCGQCGRAFDR